VKARVQVMFKEGVLDPQGQAVQHALTRLGYTDVATVRQGKVFELELDAADAATARARVAEMCDRLLANTVIETYAVEVVG
jgi:phosphoribosylformylglycinamidine synthase